MKRLARCLPRDSLDSQLTLIDNCTTRDSEPHVWSNGRGPAQAALVSSVSLLPPPPPPVAAAATRKHAGAAGRPEEKSVAYRSGDVEACERPPGRVEAPAGAGAHCRERGWGTGSVGAETDAQVSRRGRAALCHCTRQPHCTLTLQHAQRDRQPRHIGGGQVREGAAAHADSVRHHHGCRGARSRRGDGGAGATGRQGGATCDHPCAGAWPPAGSHAHRPRSSQRPPARPEKPT